MIRFLLFASALVSLVGCASSPEGDPPSSRIGFIPSDHGECVDEGGELEASSQGGRCFFYTTPRKDPSAYLHCREADGSMGVLGRGMARETTGQSHVCTLVFEPQP